MRIRNEDKLDRPAMNFDILPRPVITYPKGTPGILNSALRHFYSPIPPKTAIKAIRMESRKGYELERLAECIEAVGRKHDRKAFEELFRFYAPRIKAVLIKSGAKPEEAEEVMQETMVLVWRKAEQFDAGKASASTWIYTIARNRRIDLIRKAKRPELDPNDPFFSESIIQPDGEQVVTGAERTELIREFMKSLPEEQVLVIKKAFFEDKTHQEISVELGLPLGTVKSRIRIAMRSLRDRLSGLDL